MTKEVIEEIFRALIVAGFDPSDELIAAIAKSSGETRQQIVADYVDACNQAGVPTNLNLIR